MSSIFSETTLGGLSTFRKWLFRAAVGTIIFGVVLGVILIMTMSDTASAEVFGKTIGTMVCVGVMLIFLSTCSKLIESRKAVPQVLAIIGGIFSILWLIFAVIDVWMPSVTSSTVSCSIFDESCVIYSNPISKLMSISMYMALFGVLCGAIMNMYEGKRKDVILPLKITAAVLLGYELLYFTIITIIGRVTNPRLAALAGFAAIIWFIIWVITAVMSSSEKKKDYGPYALKRSGVMNPTPEEKAAKEEKPAAKKTDDELRAEIEEQVRREMIEKEVRERLEKEKAKEKKDDK